MTEALHVTYRPKDLNSVIGQDDVVNSLRHPSKAQVYLFTGPSGCGKTTLARILADRFAGGHADVHNLIEVNAAKMSGVADMEQVLQRTYTRAIGASPTKTVILDEAHRLSTQAWSVLLKPTEEPAPHVYWCICTTELAKVPKTIQTRALRYDLQLVDDLLLYDLVQKVVKAEKLEIGKDVIEAIAENSGGSPRQALVNLEKVKYCESAAEARRALRSAGQSREVVDLCRWLVSGKAQTWAEAVRYLKALEGTEAESIRIVMVNYLAQVLLNTNKDNNAARLLTLLSAFSTPYTQSDKLSPLLLSLGVALGLDSQPYGEI